MLSPEKPILGKDSKEATHEEISASQSSLWDSSDEPSHMHPCLSTPSWWRIRQWSFWGLISLGPSQPARFKEQWWIHIFCNKIQEYESHRYTVIFSL